MLVKVFMLLGNMLLNYVDAFRFLHITMHISCDTFVDLEKVICCLTRVAPSLLKYYYNKSIANSINSLAIYVDNLSVISILKVMSILDF